VIFAGGRFRGRSWWAGPWEGVLVGGIRLFVSPRFWELLCCALSLSGLLFLFGPLVDCHQAVAAAAGPGLLSVGSSFPAALNAPLVVVLSAPESQVGQETAAANP